MNSTEITKEIKDRWPQYEFRGSVFRLRDGKHYIRAYSSVYCRHGEVHYYCFEDDWFWHESPVFKIPRTHEQNL